VAPWRWACARETFRGELGSADSLWGMAITLALVVLGIVAGTRVFQREAA
jgi:hypothetical protein